MRLRNSEKRLLLIEKNTEKLIEQRKTRPRPTLEFKLNAIV